MPNLDLERAEAEVVRGLEELRELAVGQVVVEPARVGAHERIGAAEIAIERKSRLLRRQVPQRLVDCLAEPVRQRTVVAAARAQHAMDQAGRRLPAQAGHGLQAKGAFQFAAVRQRMKQMSMKPRPVRSSSVCSSSAAVWHALTRTWLSPMMRSRGNAKRVMVKSRIVVMV